MKNSMLFLLLLSGVTAQAQIFVQSSEDGSVVITPRGLQGNSPNLGVTNVALGTNALRSNAGGIENTAIGAGTLSNNTSGNFNTANGSNALYSNWGGFHNTASGYEALFSNTTGLGNTALGSGSLYANTTGGVNAAYGYQALRDNSTGFGNTAGGALSLRFNTTGFRNTAIGNVSLYYNTTGYNNTANGFQAGDNNKSGNNNTFIGYDADATDTSFTNATALGANTVVNASNKVRIGDDNVTVIEGQVAWSFPSDRRLKENIIYTPRLGLDFINALQTVSYNYTADKAKTRYDGFIAQDIEQVMKDLKVPFSGLKKSDNGMYSLAYSDFVMPLVNAVKEQQQKIERLERYNEALETRLSALEELKAEVNRLKAVMPLRTEGKE